LLQEEEYAIHTDKSTLPSRDEFPEFTVPKSSSFALGDNRDNSADSRHQGSYPDTSIAGYPSMILYSVELIGGTMSAPPKPGPLRWNRMLKSF
jgi:signal peptidase I